MIAGLERAIAESGLPGLEELGCAELGFALAQALGPVGSAKLEAREQIKPRVFRLRFVTGALVRSFVVKRMNPEHARRNELVIRRWLPELKFDGATPELLGLAAERDGCWVWHVYEDLGAWELPTHDPDPERVAAAVRKIASIHSRFAAHPLLAECRLHGENYGPSFFSSNVRDAVHALERLRPPHLTLSADQAGLRDRLLERLRRLLDEESMRARALAEWGGPETLLHGDLWTTNTFVEPAAGSPRVRLIDWDRAGVGPASYDLSTFLLRFAPELRPWILSLYRQSLEEGGWRMPGCGELNLLFETAECARYANRAIWPAIALLRDRVEWGFDELAAVEGWFEALGPVIPQEGVKRSAPR